MDLLHKLGRKDLAVRGRVIVNSSLDHTKALEDEFWRIVRYWREKKLEAWQPRLDPLFKKAVFGLEGSSMARHVNFLGPFKD